METPNIVRIDGINYELNELTGTATVVKSEEKYTGDIVIPSTVTDGNFKTYKVKSIGGEAFKRCSALTSIVIPDCVSDIGEHAFHGCESLISITIPDSVSSVGAGAFMGCNGLTSINLPNGLTCIDGWVFYHCISLSSVTIPESVKAIGQSAFSNCSKLKSVFIHDRNAMSIASYAFKDCPNLEISGEWIDKYGYFYKSWTDEYGVIFSSDKKTLFQAPKDLAEYVVPEGTEEIRFEAFKNCKSLKSIDIPDSVIKIGIEAFAYCELLEKVILSESLTNISSKTFWYCENLKGIHIPMKVHTIEKCAFSGCKSLLEVAIPESVQVIEEHAFDGCTKMSRVIIYGLKEYIGAYAFGLGTKVDFIVNGKKLDKERLVTRNEMWRTFFYEGDVYQGEPNGFGREFMEGMEGHEDIRTGYYYKGHFVTGPGFDERGRRHGNGYIHGMTEDEFDEWWHENS